MADLRNEATQGTDRIYGSSKNDIIHGLGGRDGLYGNGRGFKRRKKKKLLIDTDGGRDIIFGGKANQAIINRFKSLSTNVFGYGVSRADIKGYVEDSNDAGDIIGVGAEKHRASRIGDDVAFGGSGSDVVAGIGRNDNKLLQRNPNYLIPNPTGWHDDTKEDVLVGIPEGLLRFFRKADQYTNGYELKSDYLIGGSGADVYLVGNYDIADERKPEGDVVYKLTDQSSGQITRLSTQWQGQLSRSLEADISYTNDFYGTGTREDGFLTELADNKFSTGTQIVTYDTGGTGERSVTTFDAHFPGIVQNDAGDIAIRFPEGMAILNGGSDGKDVFFIKANEDGKVLAGDFGFDFPDLTGLEGNSNNYVVGDAQWILDLEATIEQNYPGLGTRMASKAQEWLRDTVYPLVDPFRKAVAGTDDVAYAYLGDEKGTNNNLETLASGFLYGLRYDAQGNEIFVTDIVV